MLRDDFDKAVIWVQERISDELANTVSASDLKNTLAALNSMQTRASGTFLIPSLFPDVPLETLYVHDIGKRHYDTGGSHTMLPPENISPAALTAIGTAIMKELNSSGNDMVHYPLDGEAEVIVFLPRVRSTVLHATGTTLLTS